MAAVRRPIFRTFRHGDFTAPTLAEEKARRGHVVSVCLPARDEAATVGADRRAAPAPPGRGLRAGRRGARRSTTTRSTPRLASPRPPGLGCWPSTTVLPELGPGEGKGEALYKSVAAAAGRPHRVVRQRHPRLRPALRRRAPRPAARPPRHPVREGLLRPSGRRPRPRRRAGHRADGAARDRGACSPTSRRSCSRSRASTPAGGRCSSGFPSCRATASTSVCSSTSPTSRAPRRSPRSTSGCAATATARSTSSARRPSPSCRRRSTAAGRPLTRPATLVRPDLEPVEVGIGERPPLVEVSGYRRQTA